MLSQIERGLANPSLNTLHLISKTLNVPIFSLFVDDDINNTIIVRKNDRIRIRSGSSKSQEYELGYDLLSPDLKGDIQLCEMTLASYQKNSEDFNSHAGEEVAVCILGEIELHLESNIYLLEKGDSVRIKKGTKHKWRNPNSDTCSIIFAITPPIF